MSRHAFLAVPAIIFFASSCTTFAPSIPEKSLRKTAEHLDRIERMADEWGGGSISNVLLIEDEGQFQINYDQPTATYVDKARSAYQGAVRRAFEYAEETQRAQVDRVNAGEAAKAALLGGPEGKVVFDTALLATEALGRKGQGPDTGAAADRGEIEQTAPALESALKANPAKGVLSSDRFTAPLALATPPTAISERSALLIGVNDKVTENILKYLAHPTAVPADKQVFLAIFQVSCNPGWRTRNGYMCDILVTPEFASGRQYSLEPYYQHGDPGSTPMVLATFPLLEAQTLDLRNSERFQSAVVDYIASVMEESGASHQAEELRSTAERLEYDAATRSPIPFVTSYSNGYFFGYQFSPIFQALENPADKNKGSANVLHRYTFPALALLIVDDCDWKSWEEIVFHVSTRWVRLSERKWWNPLSAQKRLGVMSQIAYARELDRAMESYDAFVFDYETSKSEKKYLAQSKSEAIATMKPSSQPGDVYKPSVRPPLTFARWEVDRRVRALESLGIGVTSVGKLPPRPEPPKPADVGPPIVVKVLPNRGWINAQTVLTIDGSGFAKGTESIVKSVTVAGRDCQFVTVAKSTIVAVVPPWGEDAKPQAAKGTVVVTTTQGLAESDVAIVFDRWMRVPPTDPAIEIERTPAGLVRRITINRDGVSGPKMLDMIHGVLKGHDPDANIEVIVKPGE